MKKSLLYISLIALTACSGRGGSNSQSDSAAVADSIAAIETETVEWLPDTAYPSAADVKYTLEINDTIDGHIESLEDLYASAPGIFTFRGGLKRDAAYNGTLDGVPSDIVVDWTYHTGTSATWGGGSGWTGQPLYVEWPAESRKEGLASVEREIMVGSLDGKVHFINYDSGEESRKPIGRGNPIKGTISLDPTLNGNLYVGEGIPDIHPFGAYVIDLSTSQITHMWGEDHKAPRKWYAYDSSAIRLGRFLFRPGENGCLYKFAIQPKGKLTLQSALRYKVDGVAPGIESSMAIYGNYGITADNRGNVICTNLETMRPVWLVRLGDDDDASMVIEVENGTPYVYASTEIDKQGMTGKAAFAKIRVTDGTVMWQRKFEGARAKLGEKFFDGGFYATPLLGTGNCKDLIFSSRVLNTQKQNGELIALNRKTGETVWSSPLKRYGWSSPVAMSAKDGHMYIVVGDGAGNMYVFDGINGEQLVCKNIGNNFESSPAVVGSSLVMGTRGNSIFKMTVTTSKEEPKSNKEHK